MLTQPGAMLIVEKGIDDASVIPLDRAAHVIGKSPSADIFADNPYVSRNHAQISVNGEYFEIRDLGSKNGTYLNGVRLTESDRSRLKNDDKIELARGQVILRFSMWGATATLPAVSDIETDDLKVEPRSREVVLQGTKLEPPLSRKEFDVLELLYQHRGDAVSRDEIGRIGWPEREDGVVGPGRQLAPGLVRHGDLVQDTPTL
mgnify:CR=1 FL=1